MKIIGNDRLLFRRSKPIFVKKDMETTDGRYAAFGRLIEEGPYRSPSFSFPRLCAAVGADPEELDALLWRELGYTGEALLEEYREWARAVEED